MSKTDATAKTAVKVKERVPGFADAALYRLTDTGEHVVVSAVTVPYSGPETLVFPADDRGKVIDWGEVGGGRGYLDHVKALASMGYEVSA